MGNVVKWSLPATEAGWTKTYIESSTDQITWVVLTNQAIADNTYYDENGGSNTYYRIRFYNETSLVYSGYSNIAAGELKTTTYCTPEDVQRVLQIDDLGGIGRSKPTRDDIIDFILDAEEEINRLTKHSWKSTTITDEIYSTNANYVEGSGFPIPLNHRKIKTLTEASGDKLEIWDGSEWTDLISSTSYTEGRDADYWLDYEQGILYIKDFHTIYENGIRLTYRYGETIVPKTIRNACSLLAGIQILDTNDRTVMVPEGVQYNSYTTRITRMQEKVDKILESYTEFNLIQ
jgi:hypothetical protein